MFHDWSSIHRRWRSVMDALQLISGFFHGHKTAAYSMCLVHTRNAHTQDGLSSIPWPVISTFACRNTETNCAQTSSVATRPVVASLWNEHRDRCVCTGEFIFRMDVREPP